MILLSRDPHDAMPPWPWPDPVALRDAVAAAMRELRAAWERGAESATVSSDSVPASIPRALVPYALFVVGQVVKRRCGAFVRHYTEWEHAGCAWAGGPDVLCGDRCRPARMRLNIES